MHEVMGGCKVCGRRMLTKRGPWVWQNGDRLQGRAAARGQSSPFVWQRWPSNSGSAIRVYRDDVPTERHHRVWVRCHRSF